MSVAINKMKTSQTVIYDDYIKALISMTSAMAAGATCALVGGLTVFRFWKENKKVQAIQVATVHGYVKDWGVNETRKRKDGKGDQTAKAIIDQILQCLMLTVKILSQTQNNQTWMLIVDEL